MAFGLPPREVTPRRRAKRRNPTPWADRFDSGYGPCREKKPLPKPTRMKVEHLDSNDLVFVNGTKKAPWEVQRVTRDIAPGGKHSIHVIFRNSFTRDYEPGTKVDMIDARSR